MQTWWGIERGTYLARWALWAALWSGLLLLMQYVGPLFNSAAMGPLFRVEPLMPAWQGLLAVAPWGGTYAAWAVLTVGGIACTGACVADWREHVLPDQFTLGGGACTVAGAALVWGWEHALLGAALGYAMLWSMQFVLRRKRKGVEQIGCGDVKFMLLLGAMVGPLGLLPVLGLGCLLVIPLFMLRKAAFVPFGPALALACLITLALGLRWPMV